MADDYARSVARVASAQLSELAGYESVQESAVEVLSELMIKYITELATRSHDYAELANRSSITVNEVVLGLDDMGVGVQELQTYLNALSSDDNTFAHPLPEFPVRKPGRVLPTFQEKNEIPPPHIPAFLPAFPDKHTYVQTPQFEAHEENPNKQMETIQAGRKQAEKSLLQLHYNLSRPAAQREGAGAAGDSAGTGDGVDAANPFLSRPDTHVVPLGAGVQGGAAAGPGSSTAAAPGSTGAFQPGAAIRAFKAVLPPELVARELKQEAGAMDTGDVGIKEEDDLHSEEELAITWKGQEWTDRERPGLKRTLGASWDFGVAAASAALAYGPSTAQKDAFEEVGGGMLGGGSRGTKRKGGAYGSEKDIARSKAEEMFVAAGVKEKNKK